LPGQEIESIPKGVNHVTICGWSTGSLRYTWWEYERRFPGAYSPGSNTCSNSFSLSLHESRKNDSNLIAFLSEHLANGCSVEFENSKHGEGLEIDDKPQASLFEKHEGGFTHRSFWRRFLKTVGLRA
jgi:hypothetical protein